MKRLIKKSAWIPGDNFNNIKLRDLCWEAGHDQEINDEEHTDRDIAGIYFKDGSLAIDISNCPAHSNALINYITENKINQNNMYELEDEAQCYFMGFKNQLNSNPLYYIFIDDRVSPISKININQFEKDLEKRLGGSIWILDYYRNRII